MGGLRIELKYNEKLENRSINTCMWFNNKVDLISGGLYVRRYCKPHLITSPHHISKLNNENNASKVSTFIQIKVPCHQREDLSGLSFYPKTGSTATFNLLRNVSRKPLFCLTVCFTALCWESVACLYKKLISCLISSTTVFTAFTVK